jgi:hypothetical protein
LIDNHSSSVLNGASGDSDNIKYMRFKRVILLTADMHVGSRYALAPDDWNSCKEGNPLELNQGQQAILEHWNFCMQICKKWKVDTAFFLGDITNGVNKQEFGIQQMTTDLDEQIDGAVKLLKPLRKQCRNGFYFCSGSGYHESVDTRIHMRLSEILNGTFLGAVANVKIRNTTRTLNVAHGVSSAFIYRTMLMSREALFLMEAEQLGKLEIPIDMVVRAHWHKFIHIHQEKIHMVQLPGWQAFVPWKGAMTSYGKFQPDVGMCLLFIDSENRMMLHHYTMRHVPHIGDKVWEG